MSFWTILKGTRIGRALKWRCRKMFCSTLTSFPARETATPACSGTSLLGPSYCKSRLSKRKGQVEALIPELIRQAKVGKVHSANLDSLDLSLDLMRKQLAGMIRDVPASQYICAKRFLADLQSGAKMWRRPDATNYFIPMYDPHVKNVGKLVQYMAKNDLRFAPEAASDEAVYLVLYRALAVYDVSANLQETNSGSRVAAK
jgi:hypothetical protein